LVFLISDVHPHPSSSHLPHTSCQASTHLVEVRFASLKVMLELTPES
jgi:hypothetical protein